MDPLRFNIESLLNTEFLYFDNSKIKIKKGEKLKILDHEHGDLICT